jgi:hypothetical protein
MCRRAIGDEFRSEWCLGDVYAGGDAEPRTQRPCAGAAMPQLDLDRWSKALIEQCARRVEERLSTRRDDDAFAVCKLGFELATTADRLDDDRDP